MRSPRRPDQARTAAKISARARDIQRRSPVGPRIYVGTLGVDGVDDKLRANPYPYRPGNTPGPPPFLSSWTNAFLLDINGNPGDGLWYRWELGGLKVDFGGGIVGGADMTVIATIYGVALPDSSKPAIDGFLDGSGGFKWQVIVPGTGGDGTSDLFYVGALDGGIDGGSL